MLRGGPLRLCRRGGRSAWGRRRGDCMPILFPACGTSVHFNATFT